MAAISLAVSLCVGQRFGRNPRLRRPDVAWIVFNPARFRKELREFLLRGGNAVAGVIEDNRARAGCALVESEDIFHGKPQLMGVSLCSDRVKKHENF